ncbi:hypothetical protein ACSBR2_037897 [Camellia fascicularis]
MFVMKMLSWNIRGLGRSEKRCKIKNVVKDRQIDILLIQETKRSNIQARDAKSIWHGTIWNFWLWMLKGIQGDYYVFGTQMFSSCQSVVAPKTSSSHQGHLGVME